MFLVVFRDMASLIPSGAEDDVPEDREDDGEDQAHSLGCVDVNIRL